MRNYEVAALLEEIADLTEIVGEESYKATAYRRAAQNITKLEGDIESYADEGKLTQIPGVGPAIAGKIMEILSTGSCRHLEKLRARVPQGVLELLRVPGLGTRTAAALWREAGVTSLKELERALQEGRLKGIKGFGEKKVAQLMASLRKCNDLTLRPLLAVALPVAEELRSQLQSLPGTLAVEIAGSVRRRKETVGDIDVVVMCHSLQEFTRALSEVKLLETWSRGDQGLKGVTHSGLPVDIILATTKGEFVRKLHSATGSKAHVAKLEGMRSSSGNCSEPWNPVCEEQIYSSLGLQYVVPELREDSGEIEAAQDGTLPELLEASQIKGDLHVHSDWSDGTSSIARIAQKAAEMGYEYVAITDHSVSLGVANGLDVARLKQQVEQIRKLNEEGAGVRVLTGVEVDIKKDGSLDLPDDLLRELDVVVASVHSSFSLAKEAMTRRIEAAIKNPNVDIIGHPTGRMLGHRDAYEVDLPALLDQAKAMGCAMEVNSSPDRLDLNDTCVRQAVERGVKIAVNTDAHGLGGLNDMILGVYTARRGWATKQDVINCMGLDELLEWLEEKHK
ncbi:MAG: DNA polymerase/3'-5' exonuclease PolX [Bacillota bacterium]